MYVREIIFQAQNEFANTVKTNEKNAGDYITKLMLVQSLLSVKCTLTSIGAGSHYSRWASFTTKGNEHAHPSTYWYCCCQRYYDTH